MQKKPLFILTQALGLISFFGLLLAPQPSYAGFQWVSPRTPATYASRAQNPSFSKPPIEPRIVQAPLPAPSRVKAAPVQGRGLVLGFADDVPLAVALRQVLPKSISFSVARDVSLSTPVSWQGGVAWRQVLSDMLAPVGLSSKGSGNKIHILVATPQGLAMPPTMEGRAQRADARMAASVENRPVSLLMPSRRSVAPAEPISSRRPLASGMQYLVPPAGVTPVALRGYGGGYGGGYASQAYDGYGGSWAATKDQTLREVLKSWAYTAGIDLSWQSEYDYPLQASVSLTGSFEGAVRQLLVGFENAEPQPCGSLHKSRSAGQTVLVIKTRGNKNTD